MGGVWKKATTEARIQQSLDSLGEIEIKDLTREKNFGTLSIKEGYRVDGVHMYIEFTNAAKLLDTSQTEGVLCHKKYIRFLNLYQRAIYEVLKQTDAKKIDFQNHRLHTVVYKPYNSDSDESGEKERERLVHVLGIASLVQKLLKKANKKHDDIEDVKVAIGIETGEALAVQNGTRGDREPLFLGPAANDAAKVLKSKSKGVYIGDSAMSILELDQSHLSQSLLDQYEEEADLGVNLDALLDTWSNSFTKLADISFTRPTPPMKNFTFEGLTPKNSKRFEGVSLFVDIDGFSKFVADKIDDGDEEEVVKVLHVLRKELRDVLQDFDGRKVRYHGDCIQGVMMEGTSKTTDALETIDAAIKCAGAMRSAFDVATAFLGHQDDLGLAIGLAYGPIVLTGLGIKGQRDRCAFGRCVFESEQLQRECSGDETYVNKEFVDNGSKGVEAIFEDGRRQDDLDYNTVCSIISAVDGNTSEDSKAKTKIAPIIPKPFYKS